MNYKRAVRLLGIILVISIIIVIGYKITDTASSKRRIEEKIGLSADEKESMNYKQLVADIKAVESGRNPKYAKEIADNGNTGKAAVDINVGDSTTYYGDGYTIGKLSSSDATIYEFYLKGRCTYVSVINESDNGKAMITKQTKEILLFIILAIMGCIEIIFYVKYKKEFKTNKNIEDKKSV